MFSPDETFLNEAEYPEAEVPEAKDFYDGPQQTGDSLLGGLGVLGLADLFKPSPVRFFFL